MRGNAGLDDTIRRLKAYEDAGAKVLIAPGLPDLEAVKTICSALSTPFNFMVAIPCRSCDVASLQASGVRLISLATAIYRSAMQAVVDAATEARQPLTRQSHHIFAEQADDTPTRPLRKIEELQKRRLARTGRAGEKIETAAGERKADVRKRLTVQPIAQADIFELDDGRHGRMMARWRSLLGEGAAMAQGACRRKARPACRRESRG